MPPTPISGNTPSARTNASASTRGESANSGRPESPPGSFAFTRSRKLGGRLTVVLPTIMPSMRWRRASPATSSRSPSVKPGAILSSSGARVDRAGQKHVERRRRVEVAQAGLVGRGHIDGEEGDARRKPLDAGDIV